jgi:O-antigen biosynthesis protein
VRSVRLLRRCTMVAMNTKRRLVSAALQALRGIRSCMTRAAQRVVPRAQSEAADKQYAEWVRRYDSPAAEDRGAIERLLSELSPLPSISVIIAAHGGFPDAVLDTLGDLTAQIYRPTRICLLGNIMPPHIRRKLSDLAVSDRRINTVELPASGDLAQYLTQELEASESDFITILDPGDRIPPHAFAHFAMEAKQTPGVGILYADEDIVTVDCTREQPRFKPNWNVDLFFSENYLGRPYLIRTETARRLGGFRSGFGRAVEYDLLVRIVETMLPAQIKHIPFVLCHRRSPNYSDVVADMQRAELEVAVLHEHFYRTNSNATASVLPDGRRHVAWQIPDPAPLVSLVVPTRDRVELLRTCIEGFRNETDYPNLEIIIADNDSREPETKAYFLSLADDPRVRIVPCPGPFNFAGLNNTCAAVARGKLIGFMNNDLKVIEPGWLREMVGHGIRPDVGAVGALLFYGNSTVQHAGIVLGIGGVASHIHKGLAAGNRGYFGRVGATQNVAAVTAACLLTRLDLYRSIGGMDQNSLAIAYNDVDLCMRIRRKGYRVVFTPFARLYHLESASRGSDQDPTRRSRLDREKGVMRERWGDDLVTDPYYSPNLSLQAVDCRLAFPPRLIQPWKTRISEPDARTAPGYAG